MKFKLLIIFIIMLLISLTGALADEVSYYDFEENTGTTLIDQLNNYNGGFYE